MTPPSEAEFGSASKKRRNVYPWILGAFGLGSCFICIAGGALLAPIAGRATAAAQSRGCIQRLGQQAAALALYCDQNDGRLPPDKTWMDSISPILPNVRSKILGPRTRTVTFFGRGELRALRCPVVTGEGYGYAFERMLSSKDVSKVEDKGAALLTFDSVQLQRNASAEAPDPPSTGRHDGKNNFSFLDGHVKSYPAEARLPEYSSRPVKGTGHAGNNGSN